MALLSFQLWSHVYRKTFHVGTDTNNLTEAFNNAFRSRYLKLRQDTTVYSLVQVLTDIVFPEQEKEYAIAVAQQMDTYRTPRYKLPDFLTNRPYPVQAECLAGMQAGAAINRKDLTEVSEGSFEVCQGSGKAMRRVLVNIVEGKCTCSYYIKSNIPCKHMFAVFTHYPHKWSWKDLPVSLTESSYMTLDSPLLHSSQSQQPCDEDDMPGSSEASTSTLTSHVLSCTLTRKQTDSRKLLLAQRQARDALSKCISVVYSVDKLEEIQMVTEKAEELYSSLVNSIQQRKSKNELPSFPLLATAALTNSRAKAKLQACHRPVKRTKSPMGQVEKVQLKTKRRKMDDPLNMTKKLSTTQKVIRRKQRKFPPRPRQMTTAAQLVWKAKHFHMLQSAYTI